MGHFTLTVDVESLRSAQTGLQTLSEHLTLASSTISGAPEDIGDEWTGRAATKITGEMTLLGTATGTFSGHFHTAAEAVRVFADAVEVFEDTTLVQYNQKWADAEAASTAAYAGADTTYRTAMDRAEDLSGTDRTDAESAASRARSSTRGQVASGDRYTFQAIAYGYGEEYADLVTKATTAGTALGTATAITVPDSVATDFVNHGGTGTTIGWCDADGTVFPPDLDANGQISGLGLSEDQDQYDAGEAAVNDFNDRFGSGGPYSDEEVNDYLATLDPDSEAFRQAFLAGLDPQLLLGLQSTSRVGVDGDDADAYGSLITAVSRMLALGSNEETQGVYTVSDSVYTDLVDTYTDPDRGGEGYLYLSEVVNAGQGDTATWDSDLITDIAERTLAYEREQIAENPMFSWSNFTTGRQPAATQASHDLFGDNPSFEDAVTSLFRALSMDPDAAQDVVTTGNGRADTDLLHYLYDRAQNGQTAGLAWGQELTGALEAATSFVGAGAEGTQNYASAEIVSDLVSYLGQHPDRVMIGMEQNLVDILTNHIQAVNWAGQGFVGPVTGNDANGPLLKDQIALANLDDGQLGNLLDRVFQLDYYTDDDTHPLYTQLSTMQHLAFRNDFLDIAASGRNDRLETLTEQMSHREADVTQSLIDGLMHEGATADESNQAARAALNFVLGLGIDQIPKTGLTGPTGYLAGKGLEGLKGLITNAVIPESHYAQQAMAEGVSAQEYQRRVTNLQLVQWMQESDMLQGTHSPQAWATSNPDQASFLNPDGTMVDVAELYARKDEPGYQDQWNDFLSYYQQEGNPALAEFDLGEQFNLGFLTSDNEDGG